MRMCQVNDSATTYPGQCPNCGRVREQTYHRCWPSAEREFGRASEAMGHIVSTITKIDFRQLARDESRRDVARKRRELRRV